MISASWSNFCARAVLEHVAGGRANLSEGGCVGAAHCVWSISRGPFFGTRKWTQKWGRPIKLHYKTSSKMALVLGPPMPILVILLSGGSCRTNSGLIWPLYILIFRAWVGEGALAKAWRPIVWAWLCQEAKRIEVDKQRWQIIIPYFQGRAVSLREGTVHRPRGSPADHAQGKMIQKRWSKK